MAQQQQHSQRRPRGLSATYSNESERLAEILQDKSVLALPLLSKDNWIKNEQRPHCYFCARMFHAPFVRKHHCRGCGEVVCRSCNRHRKVRVFTRMLTVRLCFDCIDKAMIGSGKHGDASFRLALDDEAETPDCDFMGHHQQSSSVTDTTTSSTSMASSHASYASSASPASSASSVAASVVNLEYSSCNSSGALSDSSFESERAGERSCTSSNDSNGGTRTSTRAKRRQQRRHEPVEFLSKDAQHEIYEERRRELLQLYEIMDSGPQPEYDALCELASRALECTVAAVAFVDTTRQWYKARIGIAQPELPRHVAFCANVLDSALPTIVMDATQDPRFSANPLVTGSARIRFYATTPICDPGTGIVIGSVFVMDPTPKSKLPARAMEILAYLSTATEKLLLNGQASSNRLDASERASGLMYKRKRRVHSSPAIVASSDCQLPWARAEVRAASLQCVPEEFEDKDGVAHAIPRTAREHKLYRLIDPDTLLPQRLNRCSSESSMSAARASCPSARVTRSDSGGSTTIPRSWTQHKSETSQPSSSGRHRSASSMDSSSSSDSDVCLDLLRRISSTQQLLAQQQSALLLALSEQSLRIPQTEPRVDSLESAMRGLSTGLGLGREGEVEVEV